MLIIIHALLFTWLTYCDIVIVFTSGELIQERRLRFMDNQKVAKRLRELRAKKGISSYELAKAVGISASAVSMYEIGERIPRDEIKLRLARFYDVTVEALFFAD